MAHSISDQSAELQQFVTERHLATLSTHRADDSIHVVPVGFTYDAERRIARIITQSGSRKVANINAHPGSRVSVCQVDGGRWLTLEGPAEVTAVPERVAEAVDRYTHRYRQPGESADRVVIEIAVDHIMGNC